MSMEAQRQYVLLSVPVIHITFFIFIYVFFLHFPKIIHYKIIDLIKYDTIEKKIKVVIFYWETKSFIILRKVTRNILEYF